MPSSKRRKPNARGELIAPSSVLDTIDNCLKDMNRTWPVKELTAEEIEHWHQDLSPFPAAGLSGPSTTGGGMGGSSRCMATSSISA